MAVYVDDLYKYNAGKFGRMKMSHMIADTKEELLDMARKIGVNAKWIQNEGTYQEHFDICFYNREKAVEAGAKEITWKELGKIVLSRKPPKSNNP